MDIINLLLVEDDENLAFMLKGSLELKGGYEVHTVLNGKEGLEVNQKIHPDIIVADVEMPEMSGFEMVQKIRETDSHTPIIFASALHSPKALIEGFEIGADNFIRKPYLPEELHVQIASLLRRVNGDKFGNEKSKNVYEFGRYRLNVQRKHLLLDGTESERLNLTGREVNILKMLLDNKGEVVKRDEMLNHLWGDNSFYTARSLDVFMTNIRKYLKKDNSVEIQTIRGEGFRLIVEEK